MLSLNSTHMIIVDPLEAVAGGSETLLQVGETVCEKT